MRGVEWKPAVFVFFDACPDLDQAHHVTLGRSTSPKQDSEKPWPTLALALLKFKVRVYQHVRLDFVGFFREGYLTNNYYPLLRSW